jgi:membrane protein YdbS with pleckstrin-like domain
MTMPATEIFQARFNPLIKPFLVFQIGLAMAMTIIGIPFAVIWFLGVGPWWAKHYYDKLECSLSDTTIRYRKGILIQVEKTIPLENIQDVTFLEGPILRYFQLSTLKFETASHSVGQASDMHLTGIMDAREFRNMILVAREELKQRAKSASGSGNPQTDTQAVDQLASLRGIERRLDDIIDLIKQRNVH